MKDFNNLTLKEISEIVSKEVFYEQNYCSECGVRFLWEGR